MFCFALKSTVFDLQLGWNLDLNKTFAKAFETETKFKQSRVVYKTQLVLNFVNLLKRRRAKYTQNVLFPISLYLFVVNFLSLFILCSSDDKPGCNEYFHPLVAMQVSWELNLRADLQKVKPFELNKQSKLVYAREINI